MSTPETTPSFRGSPSQYDYRSWKGTELPTTKFRRVLFGKSMGITKDKEKKGGSRSPLQWMRLRGGAGTKSAIRSPGSAEYLEALDTDLRISKATEALKRIQSQDSSSVDKKVWTSDDEDLLDQNIKLLQRTIDDRGTDTATRFQQRRKRSLSESQEPGDFESQEYVSDSSEGSKRAKVSSSSSSSSSPSSSRRRARRPPISLEDLNPRPFRIDYNPHPLEDRSNEWYISSFRQLFDMCETFVHTYFGIQDLPAMEHFEHDRLKLSPEFISWAEQICVEDELVGGWDYIFGNTDQRQWLVLAILSRVLRVKIFDTDLWGADEDERELLMGLDRALLNREGFERTLLRSQTVHTILGRRPVTRNFYLDVAQLTAQITLLLKPLSDYLTSIPLADNQKLPNPQDQYQALHNIVSTAAFLSLCIRLSPTIFHIVDINLGDRFDPDDHLNLDWDYWKLSEKAAEDAWKEQRDAWEDKERISRRTLDRLIDKGKQDDREGRQAKEAHDGILAEMPRNPNGAFTKMSVWPMITRYKPGGERDDEQEARGVKMRLKDKDGFRIFQISKAAIVLYAGWQERKQRTSLQEFVDGKSRTMALWNHRSWNVNMTITMAAIFGAGWFGREVLRSSVGFDVVNGVATLGGFIRTQ